MSDIGVSVQLHSDQIRALLTGAQVQEEIQRRATRIAQAAGPRVEVVPLLQRRERAGSRVVARKSRADDLIGAIQAAQ
ncbi:MAG: hypothetical protein Q3999_05100 [Buchananella hordeovulneris]|nr:hypothetical protein [Buchananella hordeovulneris]